MTSVKSRAYRILRPMKSFSWLSDDQEAVQITENLELKPDEEIIGLYRNNPDTLVDALIVTNMGIHKCSENDAVFIAYSSIRDQSAPAKEDVGSSEITIFLHDGAQISISIRGQNGRFRDIYEFQRFLIRVNEDLQFSG